jgi:hypothetical protein
MAKVEPLRPADVSPRVLLEAVGERVDELERLYCVGINKEGEPIVWLSGGLNEVVLASFALHRVTEKLWDGTLVLEGDQDG